MPTVRVPLVGSNNQRGLDADAALVANQDQRFLNCTFTVVTNPITGKSTVYVEKRPGWGLDSLVAAGSASTGLRKPQLFDSAITAYGDANSTIYLGSISVGVITGRALHFEETLISAVGYVVLRSSDGTGWYYVDGAKDVTAYTMDGNNSTTVTDIKIAGANSTAGLYPGQKLTAAANIVAGTRVVSVNSGAFTAVVDTTTTGGAFNDLAVTKEPIAKIIDADFVSTGTYIGAFAAMDGYLFYPDDSGYMNNSDLNSAAAYTANARIAVQQSPDPTIGVAIQKNIVVAFGLASNEKFQNAGFSSGSPLQVLKQQVEHIGALDQRSITTIDDDIYYVSTPSEGDLGVYRMRGLQSTPVGNSIVNKIIGTVAVAGAVYASSYKLNGCTYAAFSLSTASDGPASFFLLESGDKLLLENGDDLLLEDTAAQAASFVRKMVYNATLNIWGEWDDDEGTFVDSIGSGTANKLIATSRFSTGGKVYRMDPVADGQLYQDDGSAFTMEIRTTKLFDGPERKFVDKVVLIGWDSTNTTMPYLSYSDDDYQTWSSARQFVMIGGIPTLLRCGTHRNGRAYKITDSANAPFRAEALGITYQQGEA